MGDQSAMNRLHQVFALLFLISTSISERLGCDVNGTNVDDTETCKARPCPVDESERNKTNVQFKEDFDPRFDQMFALRIIGGACVTQSEIYEAYMKLIYIYSCIFPIIHDKQIKDLNSNTTIRFGDILQLDQTMQTSGRIFLHSREENDPELIKRKVDDFIKDLLERNAYKEYRRFKIKNETSTTKGPEPTLNATSAKPPLSEMPTTKPIVNESITTTTMDSTTTLGAATKPNLEDSTTTTIPYSAKQT